MNEHSSWLACPFCNERIHPIKDNTVKNRLICPKCHMQFPIRREFSQYSIDGKLIITYGDIIERGVI